MSIDIDSDFVKKLRKKQRLNQSELADLIGVSTRTIQNWEGKKRNNASQIPIELTHSGEIQRHGASHLQQGLRFIELIRPVQAGKHGERANLRRARQPLFHSWRGQENG